MTQPVITKSSMRLGLASICINTRRALECSLPLQRALDYLYGHTVPGSCPANSFQEHKAGVTGDRLLVPREETDDVAGGDRLGNVNGEAGRFEDANQLRGDGGGRQPEHFADQ